MNTLSVSRLAKCWVSFLVVMQIFCMASLEATYIQVFNTTTNGALAWTGNTLGLNKANNQNNQGNAGSIGAFITTDTSQKVPPPSNYPFGTTLDWKLNSSSAVLDIPPGSKILWAELIWSGSYGFDPAITSTNTTPVLFTTPNSLTPISITPRTDTAQSRTSASTGSGVPNGGFYVRSATVTSLVTGGGTYTVGHVPGTVVAAENNLNCCGWTLAVAYENPNMFTSNLTLYTACEPQGVAPALVQGFQAPNTGTIVARVFTSALEGDAQLSGDQFRIGPTSTLGPANAISGTNNPDNNFFASQINTQLNLTTDITSGKLVYTGPGLLDTRGSFGTSNSNAITATSVSGARQGYDITSIDISNIIAHGQTQLYAQGTTNQDVYTTNAFGLQIQVLSPVIESTKAADQTSSVPVGTTINFTITFTNIGESTATSVSFSDPLPSFLTYSPTIPSSFKVNGVPQTNLDVSQPYSLSDLAVNASTTITFPVTVNSYPVPPASPSIDNFAKIQYDFPSFGGQTVTATSQTNTVTITAPTIAPPVAFPDSYTTTANTTLTVNNINTGVLADDTGTGIFVSSYDANSAQGGSISMTPNGFFGYTPPLNFSGIDTFIYSIKDSLGQGPSTTTVTITVLPQAISDTGSVTANTTLNQTISVLDNDLGTGLSVTTYTQPTQPGSSVVVNADGTYSYTPAPNFSGIDTFTYTATDSSGHSSIATVTITVLPKASDDYGTTPANTTLHGTTVFSNDTSGLTLIGWDSTSVQGGTVTMDNNPSSPTYGTYNYTPPTNYSGSDTFTYTVQDSQGNQATATVHITVLPLAVPDTGTTESNSPLNQTTSVLNNDAGTGLSISTYDTISIHGGTIVMQPNGTYIYNPPANYVGQDSFNYTLKDQLGNTSTTQVAITINQGDVHHVTIPENTTLLAPSVLLDPDDAGKSLNAAEIVTPPTHGIVSMNTDGTFTYIPDLNFVGTDLFLYKEYNVDTQESETETQFILVTPVPDPTNFVGRICKCEFLDKTVYNLVATWNGPVPADPSVTYYGIFLNGKMVAKVLVGAPLVYRTSSTSKSSLYSYVIKAFNLNNTPSDPVTISIVSDTSCCKK